MDFDRGRRRMHEINLIPMIDVVFNIMVFVMLTSTFVVSESMELTLPSGKAHAMTPVEVTRIQIAPTGDLFVNQQPLSEDRLSEFLVHRLATDPEAKIAIFTTPGVSVQQLVTVLDTVYLTGGRNVQVDKVD